MRSNPKWIAKMTAPEQALKYHYTYPPRHSIPEAELNAPGWQEASQDCKAPRKGALTCI